MALKNEEEEGVDFELLNVFTTCPTDKDHSYSYHSDVISINDKYLFSLSAEEIAVYFLQF